MNKRSRFVQDLEIKRRKPNFIEITHGILGFRCFSPNVDKGAEIVAAGSVERRNKNKKKEKNKMEKTKRLSKSSIAVIVLSILLVLSMVMGLTGAWFTSADEASTSGTFGTVNIAIDGDNVSFTKWEGEQHELMPGDKLTDILISNDSNVKIYVRYSLKVQLDGYVAAAGRLAGEDSYTYPATDEGAALRAADQKLVDLQGILDTSYGVTGGQGGWRYIKTYGSAAVNETPAVDATYDATAYSTAVAAGASHSEVNQIVDDGEDIYIVGAVLEGLTYGNAFQGKTINVHFEVQAIQAANFANAAAAWTAVDSGNGLDLETGLLSE